MVALDPRLVALRDWLPGQVLRGTRGAQYHLRERVGEGGQGWVFSASWDEPGGYAVIVKVLRPDAVTPEAFQRFEREAQVLRMLGQAARPNPHVVRFFDHATAQLNAPSGPIALPFTVLEHVRGPTLESILERSRGAGLALDRTRRLARQVVLALEDVHAHKIVHRDLKPSNVLLAKEGDAEVAKVTDFGLVKLVDVGLGRTTALAGATLGYAPPEQFEQGNRRVSVRTDVFSFASMLYEMLTGVKAFPYGEGENPLLVVTRLLNGPRPSLTATRGSLPRELAMRPDLVAVIDALLTRATAAEPSERPASIAELWSGLEPSLRAASERPSFPDAAPAAPDVATAVDIPTPPPPMRISSPPRPGEVLDVTPHRPKTPPPPPPAEEPESWPGAWTWRVRATPAGAGAVAAAAFEPGGDMAVAVGADGFRVWEGSGAGSGWSRPPAGHAVDARSTRGMVWLGPGELLVFGARGLAARWVVGAGLDTWTPPDPEVTFLGAHVDAPGTTVTLVGERPSRRASRTGTRATTMGVIAQFARGKLTLLSDVPTCTRLRGVTRLRNGEVVACGDWGLVVRLELGVPNPVGSICGGHLHAISAAGEGAIAVGAGGHALSLSRSLTAQLEAVQTTRDLLSLAIDSTGTAWAGSAQARVLRRTRTGAGAAPGAQARHVADAGASWQAWQAWQAWQWVRMSAELGLSSSVLALSARPRLVRAIGDDGAVIEGTVSHDHLHR
jgi:serine/threonine-protein kinase